MVEILKYCHAVGFNVGFSFDVVPGFIQITISKTWEAPRSQSYKKTMSQTLPWDHMYESTVLDCIKFMITEINKKT